MFWSSLATSSGIDQVLDEADVTLQKVLEQDEVLQELRAQNKKLVEFLSRPESLNGMVDLIILPPSGDVPLLSQYKLPNMACEVLTSDNAFLEKVTADKNLLNKMLYFFKDVEPPINPLLASYVCRVLGEIVTRKLDQNWYSYQLNLIQLLGHLESEEGAISFFLKHLDCSAVCEFIFKLVLNVEGQERRTSLYEWLITRERLNLRLMEKMNRCELEDVHANVSRLTGDLINAFQDEVVNSTQDRCATDCDPFLLALRSLESITALLNTLFQPDSICETSIIHGLDLVLSLVGVTRRSPRMSGRNDTLDELPMMAEGLCLSDTVKTEILSRMPTLLNLLEQPVHPEPLKLTNGTLERPVGPGRLAIAKFIAHLFSLEDQDLNEGMIKAGVLKQLLDLFWANPWNNFLHRYVTKIMICIGKSPTSPSTPYLLELSADLLRRVIEAFEDPKSQIGYRGHLAKVAQAWGEALEAPESPTSGGEEEGSGSPSTVMIKSLIQSLEKEDAELHSKWGVFYKDTLEQYLANEKVFLGGVQPPVPGGLPGSSTLASESLNLPYNDADVGGGSSSSATSGIDWFRSQMMNLNSSLNADSFFNDNATDLSLTNLHLSSSNNSGSGGGVGGGDETMMTDTSKAKALFEMFMNDKSNSFDSDSDEEMRERNSSDEEEEPEGEPEVHQGDNTKGEDELMNVTKTVSDEFYELFGMTPPPPLPTTSPPTSLVTSSSSIPPCSVNMTEVEGQPESSPMVVGGQEEATKEKEQAPLGEASSKGD